MSKKIIYSIISIIAIYGCVVKMSTDTYIDRILEGKWKIENTDSTLTIASPNIIVLNDSVYGEYRIVKNEDLDYGWIWDVPEYMQNAIYGIDWKIDNDSGMLKMIYMDKRDSIFKIDVVGYPYKENDTLTLVNVEKPNYDDIFVEK